MLLAQLDDKLFTMLPRTHLFKSHLCCRCCCSNFQTLWTLDDLVNMAGLFGSIDVAKIQNDCCCFARWMILSVPLLLSFAWWFFRRAFWLIFEIFNHKHEKNKHSTSIWLPSSYVQTKFRCYYEKTNGAKKMRISNTATYSRLIHTGLMLLLMRLLLRTRPHYKQQQKKLAACARSWFAVYDPYICLFFPFAFCRFTPFDGRHSHYGCVGALVHILVLQNINEGRQSMINVLYKHKLHSHKNRTALCIGGLNEYVALLVCFLFAVRVCVRAIQRPSRQLSSCS